MEIGEMIRKLRITKSEELRRYAISCFPENSEITKGWQRNSRTQNEMSNGINGILKNHYEPLGRWLKKPDKKGKLDEACWDEDGERMRENFLNTNYTCHTMIFNRANILLIKWCKDNNVDQLIYDGTIFSPTNLIKFDNTWKDDIDGTVEKIKLQLKLTEFFKEEIYIPGTTFHEDLINQLIKSKILGERNELFFVNNIYSLLTDIVNVDHNAEAGDVTDRNGIDCVTTDKNGQSKKYQIKGARIIDLELDGGYRIVTSFSFKNPCDYYVFVRYLERIMVFNFNPNLVGKYKKGSDVFFPKSLLVIDKKYKKMNNEITKIIGDLHFICSKNKINFELTMENEETKIFMNEEPKKKLTIHIGNQDDKNLFNLLKQQLVELEEVFH